MRWKVWSATSISVWQHVKLSVQIRPWDTLACCWDVKQLTTNNPLQCWTGLPVEPVTGPCLWCHTLVKRKTFEEIFLFTLVRNQEVKRYLLMFSFWCWYAPAHRIMGRYFPKNFDFLGNYLAFDAWAWLHTTVKSKKDIQEWKAHEKMSNIVLAIFQFLELASCHTGRSLTWCLQGWLTPQLTKDTVNPGPAPVHRTL